jgi:hypothetical protein
MVLYGKFPAVFAQRLPDFWIIFKQTYLSLDIVIIPRNE